MRVWDKSGLYHYRSNGRGIECRGWNYVPECESASWKDSSRTFGEIWCMMRPRNRYWVICKTKRERTTSVESRRRDSRLEIEVELVVVPKSCDA